MNLEELPKNMQYQIDTLKHGALTIQADILNILESAGELEEFQSQLENCMDEIIGEAQGVRMPHGTGKRSVVHG